MKIYLVQAPTDELCELSIRTKIYPTNSLSLIAGYVLERLDNLQIEILDGNILTFGEIINEIQKGSDLVGFSCNIWNYKNTVLISKIAKELDNIIVYGGHLVSCITDYLVNELKFIDYIVLGDGEEAFKKIIETHMISKHNHSLSNRLINIPISIDNVSFPNYCNIDIKLFYANFRKKYYKNYKAFNGGFANTGSKGCQHRFATKGCIFCSIPTIKPQYIEPKIFWKNIVKISKFYDVNFFWETGDSFLSNKIWLKELLKSKPKEASEIFFEIYARADELDNSIIPYLKELNIYSIFIGMESADTSLLKKSNKLTTCKQNYEAIELLNKNDIKAIPGFVIGLYGETKASLEKTKSMAYDFSKAENVYETSVSTLLPIPNSTSFKMLSLKENISLDYHGLSPMHLKKIWLKNFTKIDYDLAIMTEHIIKNFYEYNGGGF